LGFGSFAVESATALGSASSATGDNSTAVGRWTEATGRGAVAIGGANFAAQEEEAPDAAIASGDGSIALGGAIFSEDGSTLEIAGAQSTGTQSIAVGTGSVASGAESISLGSSAQATRNGVGMRSVVTASGATAIGGGDTNSEAARARGAGAIAIGGAVYDDEDDLVSGGAKAESRNSIAIGSGARSQNLNSIAIGFNATTTLANQIVIGTSTQNYQLPGLGNAAFSNGRQNGELFYVTTDGSGKDCGNECFPRCDRNYGERNC